MRRKNLWYTYYKGFTILQINGVYRADAYCYSELKSKNLQTLKKIIRTTLNKQ